MRASMTAILLADDNPATRSALVLLLTARLGCADIAVAGDWQALKDASAREQPVLILLDWELPGFLPQDGLPELHAIAPGTAVIALSSLPESDQASKDAGARDFIGKCDSPDKVLRIISAAIKFPSKPVE